MHTVITKNWFSFVILLVYMGTVLCFFPLTYGINDDAAILWDIQSGHMVSFMSILLGNLLSFCYRNISSNIPWFSLTLYTFLGISIYCVIISTWKFTKNNHLLIPVLVIFLALCLKPLIHISYNMVSISLASGSLLSLWIYLEKADKKRFLIVILMGICFSFSYHIRMDGIKATLCFTALPLLLFFFRIRKCCRHLLLFLIPLAITIPANHFYENSLATESDVQYREWNTLRGQFHGFSVELLNADNEQIRKANNWSKNDYLMLTNWMYLDENKFNISSLKNVFKYAFPPPALPYRLLSAKGYFIDFVQTYPIYLCILLFIALLGFWTLNGYSRIMPIIYLVYILTGAITMHIFFRFPGRIGFPILLNCIPWMAFMVFNHNSSRLNNYGRILTIFSFFLFTFFTCIVLYGFCINARNTRLNQINQYKSIQELEAMQGNLFLIPAQNVFYQVLNPLHNHRFTFKTIPCGWPIYSPLFYKALRENGMKHAYELLPKIAQNKNCYIVGNNEDITLISEYLKETFHIHIKVVLVKQLSNHLIVFRIEAI